MGAGAYSPAAALGLAIGGVPAVLAAAWRVRSLCLAEVAEGRALVVAVVAYAATSMLRSAAGARKSAGELGGGGIR